MLESGEEPRGGCGQEMAERRGGKHGDGRGGVAAVEEAPAPAAAAPAARRRVARRGFWNILESARFEIGLLMARPNSLLAN